MFKQVMCGLSKWIPDSFRRGLANLPPVRSANHAEGATRSGKIELSHEGGKVCVEGRRGRGKVCDCVLLLPPLLHLLLYPLLSSLPPSPPHCPHPSSITPPSSSLPPSLSSTLPSITPSLHHPSLPLSITPSFPFSITHSLPSPSFFFYESSSIYAKKQK